RSPAATASQAAWFLFYGLASTLYRIFITLVIALFIATRFFFVGVLLALWALVMMAVVPLVRALGRFRTQPHWRERRFAAGAGAAAVALGLAAALAWVPFPYRTHVEGVVWLPERASLRAG